MSDVDNGQSTTGGGTGGGSGPEPATTPFLSAPPSLGSKTSTATETSKAPSTARPAPSTAEKPAAASTSVPKQAPAPDTEGGQPSTGSGAVVKGQITIEDEVVEKIAALAALEVDGIADLGGDVERVIEAVRSRVGVGQRRGDQGVKAKIENNEVTLDVTVVVEYGAIVMDVAKAVKGNVARVVSRMLGMRVTSVNVTVDDVHLPGAEAVPAKSAREAESADAVQPDAAQTA
jgi:uncharacterized alkaline shock family protein YloU